MSDKKMTREDFKGLSNEELKLTVDRITGVDSWTIASLIDSTPMNVEHGMGCVTIKTIGAMMDGGPIFEFKVVDTSLERAVMLGFILEHHGFDDESIPFNLPN